MLQYAGATERMNLCQAVKSAMDITMEKDSTAGEISHAVYSVFVYTAVQSINRSIISIEE